MKERERVLGHLAEKHVERILTNLGVSEFKGR